MLSLSALATKTLAEAVLVVLLALPQFSAEPVPEPPAARTERLTAATIAITEASIAGPGNWSPERVAAALVAIGWHESRFAAYVGEGRCHQGAHGSRCGTDRRGRPVARSYFQIERKACPDLWGVEEGTLESTRIAARCASRLFVGAFYRCGGAVGAFAGYARGNRCEWGPARRRARWMYAAESMIRIQLARPPDRVLNWRPLDA